jgi:hypothetical protein
MVRIKAGLCVRVSPMTKSRAMSRLRERVRIWSEFKTGLSYSCMRLGDVSMARIYTTIMDRYSYI